jgi:hypothetical protein
VVLCALKVEWLAIREYVADLQEMVYTPDLRHVVGRAPLGNSVSCVSWGLLRDQYCRWHRPSTCAFALSGVRHVAEIRRAWDSFRYESVTR